MRRITGETHERDAGKSAPGRRRKPPSADHRQFPPSADPAHRNGFGKKRREARVLLLSGDTITAVDAHHHCWRYRPGFKPWLEARDVLAPLRRDFLPSELHALMRENGIDRSVIIQALDSLEDTAYMVEAAAENEFIAGIVAWAPLDDPPAAERQFEIYAKNPKIKGFRHLIIFDPDPDWSIRPNVITSLTLAAEHGFTWDSTATIPRHLEHVDTVAERIPNLKIVIDHLGKPAASENVWEPWASLMSRAARHPNVYVKLSGLSNIATLANASVEQFRPYVEHVFREFGANRIMAASNWPVSNLGDDYATVWRKTHQLIADRTAQEREAVLGGTATRFYGL